MLSTAKYIATIVSLTIICLLILQYSCVQKSKTKILETLITDSAILQLQTTLGRYLFYDRRLSVNNTRACGTCHNPVFAFTDGYKQSIGAFADLHQRNTAAIFNVEHSKFFTAADSTIHTLQQQMEKPLFNQHPIEMGANEACLKKIQHDTLYQQLFIKLQQPFNFNTIKNSIASFVQTIHSYNSPYDAFLGGDKNAINTSAKQGMKIFFSTKAGCFNCHGGKNFNQPNVINNEGKNQYFFNTGLYNINNTGEYPTADQGLYALTKNVDDMGFYKPPTLRNLAFTAPYYHNGTAANLMDVINNYNQAGRATVLNQKNTTLKNKYKHHLIKPLLLNENQKLQLVNFLLSLSDSSFIKNPTYQNPFLKDETAVP